MGLFDSADDARNGLEEYLTISSTRGRKQGDAVFETVQAASDMLCAVMCWESSPYPMKSFVEDAKGAAHLKKALTNGEHAAWLALVAKVQTKRRKVGSGTSM
jgi:hypothetical protein